MTDIFQPAKREKLKLRMALDGPSSSGKTYTALRFAFALAGKNGRVAIIDTEHRSATKYQGLAPDKIEWQFDVCDLPYFAPSSYTAAIQAAAEAGYDVLVIDSLSHAWIGTGGALDQVDKKSEQRGVNSFTAWKDVTPQHRDMIETILASPCHVIVTMRSKMEYVLEEQTNKQGKLVHVPKKVGMAPIQRTGTEYEFDIVCDLDVNHFLTVSKTRCPALDGKTATKPTAAFIKPVLRWLDEGAEPAASSPIAPPSPRFQQPETPKPAAPIVPPGNGRPAKVNARTDAADRIDAGQIDQVKQLCRDLGWKPANLKAYLAENCGAARLANLSAAQGSILIARLQQQQTNEEADAVFGSASGGAS